LSHGLAIVAFRWPGSNSGEFLATQILADVLGSQRFILSDLTVHGEALSAGFSLDSLPEAGLGYAFASFPAGGDGMAVLRQVRKVLKKIEKNGAPADLIDVAKRRRTLDAEFQKNSIPDLALRWSEALAVEGRPSPSDDIDAIKNVTTQDLRTLARRILNQHESISVILTPRPSGKPIAASFGRSGPSPAREDAPVLLPAWAQKVHQLSIPSSAAHRKIMTLSNGLKLIVQPETVSDTVSVFGYIRNDSALDGSSEQNGVKQILDELLAHGTRFMNRVAFQRALDEIGAKESAGLDFSLEVLTKDFHRGVALLAENELHPALPARAFRIIRRRLADSMRGELQSADYITQRALESALLPDNGTYDHTATGVVPQPSLGDVRNYYRRVFRPDLTTIVVIGNVTPKRARSVIGEYFGVWKAHGKLHHATVSPMVPNQPSSTQVPDAIRAQADVTLAETLPVTRSSPDYYALNLGNQVLGGTYYASRLSRDLRENTGLVYSVSSMLDAGPTGTFYSISFGCDPDNVSRARAIVDRDLKEMQTDPVPDDVLNVAKVMLLKQIQLAESSVHGIAENLISRTIDEIPLDQPAVEARLYTRITPRQVQAAFAKWVRPENLVQVTEGPNPK
jgi:zinc protease